MSLLIIATGHFKPKTTYFHKFSNKTQYVYQLLHSNQVISRYSPQHPYPKWSRCNVFFVLFYTGVYFYLSLMVYYVYFHLEIVSNSTLRAILFLTFALLIYIVLCGESLLALRQPMRISISRPLVNTESIIYLIPSSIPLWAPVGPNWECCLGYSWLPETPF